MCKKHLLINICVQNSPIHLLRVNDNFVLDFSMHRISVSISTVVLEKLHIQNVSCTAWMKITSHFSTEIYVHEYLRVRFFCASILSYSFFCASFFCSLKNMWNTFLWMKFCGGHCCARIFCALIPVFFLVDYFW